MMQVAKNLRQDSFRAPKKLKFFSNLYIGNKNWQILEAIDDDEVERERKNVTSFYGPDIMKS